MGLLELKICEACGDIPESFYRVPAASKYWPRTHSGYDRYVSATLCVDCGKEFTAFIGGGEKKAHTRIREALIGCGVIKPGPPSKKKTTTTKKKTTTKKRKR